MNIPFIVSMPHIIVVHIPPAEIPISDKCPFVGGYIIATAISHTYTYSRAYWSPSVIITGSSPGHPSRSPFVIGNPNWPIGCICIPTPIMKRSPSPRIIRDPCPSLISQNPISVCGIGCKTRSNIGNPNVTILRIVNPGSIGA